MKRWIIAITLFAASLLIISETHAHYTVSSQAHNVITTGGVEIAVEEWQQTPQGLSPYPDTPIAVMPGREVSKIVTVRNLEKTCYVRARVMAIIMDREGKETVLSQEDVDALLQWDVDQAFWQQKENDDIWWYYTKSLQEGAVTAPLFEKILFPGQEMGNRYQGSTIRVHVTAQAVQAANNGESALLAVGWP